MTTAAPAPTVAALSVTTDRATVEIIKTPRPYMRGACIVRCSDPAYSGFFISGPAARAYIATLVAEGRVAA